MVKVIRSPSRELKNKVRTEVPESAVPLRPFKAGFRSVSAPLESHV